MPKQSRLMQLRVAQATALGTRFAEMQLPGTDHRRAVLRAWNNFRLEHFAGKLIPVSCRDAITVAYYNGVAE